MEKVTVSFVMERELYSRYKSICAAENVYVKGSLVRYMRAAIEQGTTIIPPIQESETQEKPSER